MVIKFYGFFNDERVGESLVKFRVDGEITLAEFSRRLVERFPIFRDYMKGKEDSDLLNSIFLVARNGTLLRPGDIVKDEDQLDIIAPMDGG